MHPGIWAASELVPKGPLPSSVVLVWPLPFDSSIQALQTLPKVLIPQLCPTLCDPMDCSPLGFSVHGILQARILEWVAISFSRGSSRPTDRTWVSCIAGGFFTI